MTDSNAMPYALPGAAPPDFAILCSDGVRLLVHRGVLSALSSFFCGMIENLDTQGRELGECPVPESSQVFRHLLDPLYGLYSSAAGTSPSNRSDERLATRADMAARLDLARKYDVPAVTASCRAFFSCRGFQVSMLHPFLPGVGVLSCLALAGTYDLPGLEVACLKAYCSNADSLAEQVFEEGLVTMAERCLAGVSPAAEQALSDLRRRVAVIASAE